MDCTLRRTAFRPDGVFGELEAGSAFWCVTLEHAYQAEDGSYEPKLPPGVYTCVLGVHTVNEVTAERFEITGVPGHTGILIHKGNKNADSEGCVCTGEKIEDSSDGTWSILESAAAYDRFMALQAGVQQFHLTVI